MNIQSSYGAFAYQGLSRTSGPQPAGSKAPSPADATAAGAAAGEVVSLSSAAQALADTQAGESTRTPAQEKLMRSAAADEGLADTLARDFSQSKSQVLYDISHGDLRLASNGKAMSESDIKAFEKEAAVVDARLREIYEAGKANGTPSLQILGQLIDFKNAQSDSYLDATGWSRNWNRGG